MHTFVFSENSEAHKKLVWRKFYHDERKRLFAGDNKLKTSVGVAIPVLMWMAYFATDKINNLVSACIISTPIIFSALYHLLQRVIIINGLKQISKHDPFTITLDEEGVTYQTPKSNTRLDWAYFKEYEEYEDNFTLFSARKKDEQVIIPLSFVAENEPLKQLIYRNLAQKS
jgi:hypothetical protein